MLISVSFIFQVPDTTFDNFKARISVDRRILYSSETSISDIWGSSIWENSVGIELQSISDFFKS